MIKDKTLAFARMLSVDKQLELYNNDYKNIIPDYGVVKIKEGPKYYVMIIDHTITYRVDKRTGMVYNFYKTPIGDLDLLIARLNKKINSYKERPPYTPKAGFLGRTIVKSKGYKGKVFWYSWGYDQTQNEFVKVVSETDKQVKVVKLYVTQNYDPQSMTGSEKPGNKARSAPFTLTKEVYRGELALRGTDKSGSGSSESHLWSLYDGGWKGYSRYA